MALLSGGTATLLDCEFLAIEGSPSRFWCGPYDPNPVPVQIGAVRLSLSEPFAVEDTLRLHIAARGRRGEALHVDPFLTRLTGIEDATVQEEGMSLSDALARLDAFSMGGPIWSWGRDELNLATGCFVEGVSMPISSRRFGNACTLMLAAGMPYADIKRTPSTRLAAYFGLPAPEGRDHDALTDASSLAAAVRHLLSEGRMSPLSVAMADAD